MKKVAFLFTALLFMSSCCLTKYKISDNTGRIVNQPNKMTIETRISVDSLIKQLNSVNGVISVNKIHKYKFVLFTSKYYTKDEILKQTFEILNLTKYTNLFTK
jgi:hypothetical protein